MNNYITLVLNLMVHVGVLTKLEASKLDEELQSATIPSDFESGFQLVKKVFEDADVEIKSLLDK